MTMAGGRQRAFCKDEALDKAMRIFWKKGYVGASLSDLTEVMGINKPSMYSAFGNKEQLFIQSMAHYIEHYASPHSKHLNSELSLKQRLAHYMLSILTAQCNEDCPKGCFVSSAIADGEADAFPEDAKRAVFEVRDFAETMLSTFLLQEQHAGHLCANASPKDLSRFLVTILHGTAAMARSGKSKTELESIIHIAVDTIF